MDIDGACMGRMLLKAIHIWGDTSITISFTNQLYIYHLLQVIRWHHFLSVGDTTNVHTLAIQWASTSKKRHMIWNVITSYEVKHNHEVPATRNSGQAGSGPGSTPSAAHASQCRQEPAQAHLGGPCPFGSNFACDANDEQNLDLPTTGEMHTYYSLEPLITEKLDRNIGIAGPMFSTICLHLNIVLQHLQMLFLMQRPIRS
jgi:hypothetical protein